MLHGVTNTNPQPAVMSSNEGTFEEYVSYCALGGLITGDDGRPSKMPIDDFCTTYGVSRMTLSRWKRQTPDWAARVDKRRAELMPRSRVTAVWNANYIIAIQTQDKRAAVEAQKVFLGHFGKLLLPVQRQELEVGEGLADLLQMGRAKFVKDADNIPEGTVVDADVS